MPTPIGTLLDRTTPEQVPPLDLDALARRGRRRQHRHRAAVGAAAVATVAVLAAVLGTNTIGDGRPDVDTLSPATLTEPVGSWSQAADPPFAPRGAAFGGTLSDGRVLIWGGQIGTSDEPALDGAIYDPATDQWTSIPAAPLPPLTTLSPNVVASSLVDDRLAVVGTSRSDGRTVAAVYDVAEQRWVEAPPTNALGESYDDSVAWDGETLVRVRPADDTTGQPLLQRWGLDEAEWTTGAAPPAGLQVGPAAAFDGARLAMLGGAAEGTAGEGTAGALYHVGEDRWEPLPPAPLPARRFGLAVWVGGRLLVDSTDSPLGESTDGSAPAAYDPATGTWETLEPPPEGGAIVPPGLYCSCFDAGTDPIVGVNPGRSYSSDEPLWFLGDAGWEQAPLRDLYRLGDVTVAVSELGGGFGSEPEPYQVQVRAERDRWLRAAETPFGTRMEPMVVATGDRLLVVGGLQALPPQPGEQVVPLEGQGDAWVFDLSGG